MWIKQNNKYTFSNNNESVSKLIETNHVIEKPKKSKIYIPTHNINDVYEWYRKFNDSYAFSNNYNDIGWAIHAYFSKDRGQSIDGYFKNLIKVKCSSSDKYLYYTENNKYLRKSIDFIDTFNNIDILTIDETQIFNEDLILLKNQIIEELNFITITNNLTTLQFQVNEPVIVISNGEYLETKIKNIIQQTNNTFLIELKDDIEITHIASKLNGLWTIDVDDRKRNGVYKFKDNNLEYVAEMYDMFKTRYQIVYTYLGKTNQNKEFYLNPVDEINSVNYSLFPYIGMDRPLIYNQGSAYLIEAELEYDLSREIFNIDNTCCNCQFVNQVEHPQPPFTIDDNIFRLLFLDNSIAERIFSSYINGIGKYTLSDQINIINYELPLEFNINQKILDNLYYDYQLPINTSFLGIDGYSIDNFKAVFSQPVTNDIVYTQNLDTTNISLNYNIPVEGHVFINEIEDNDLILISIYKNDILFLSETFVLSNYDDTQPNNISFDIFPKLDINIINELNSTDFDIKIEIETINKYPFDSTQNSGSQQLLNHINKSIIGKIYNFSIDNDILSFNNIRQNNKFKYLDHFCDIIYDSTTYTIDNEIIMPYRQYFYGYNIYDYLVNYIGISGDLIFNQLETFNVIYNDNILSQQRFDIFGSNKVPGKGNIITFGSYYKNIVLDKLKKQTFIKVDYLNPITIGSETISIEENIFVEKIEWNEELNIGKIYLSDYIARPAANNEIFSIIPYTALQDISDKLKSVLYKTLPSLQDTLSPYKPDTSSYAFAMMNYANQNSDELLNNITGLVYKEFNELKISFLKRDRRFLFNNSAIVHVNCASTFNLDLNNIPINIDGYLLQNNDLILIKNQIDFKENGVYIYNAGNLTRFELFNNDTYFIVDNGVLNENLSFMAKYDIPFILNESDIIFVNKNYKTKKDPRLTIDYKKLYKLGVDNLTQPPIYINQKYDLIESQENVLTIQPGINNIQQIRFIDGLTEFNILNDINGQGQYKWILNENVITNNAVVGRDLTTNKLIWYTGQWLQGTWCSGIWYSGDFISGQWLNGEVYSYNIDDYYSYVVVNPNYNINFTTFHSCLWYNGQFNGGLILDIEWLNGTFNQGVITTGLWNTGTFNDGTIKHIEWLNGIFNNGRFETGVWHTGIFNNVIPSIGSKFGIGSTDTLDFNTRTIWRSGQFNGGEFYSGDNSQHNLTVWYSGRFLNGTWYGGSFVSGQFINSIWHNGVFIGGFKIDIQNIPSSINKSITIDPAQYDTMLGLDVLDNYQANDKHNLHLYQNQFILFAEIDTPIDQNATDITYINELFNNTSAVNYLSKSLVNGSATDTNLQLSITSLDIDSTYFDQPRILAEFNGTWLHGTCLHGYFDNGIFENGIFINGFWNNGTFGIL